MNTESSTAQLRAAMYNTIKRWRTAVAALALGLMLLTSGCMTPSIIDDEDEVARLDDKSVKTIVVWHTYSDEETRVFEEEVLPAFEAEHPEIRIESVRQAYNEQYMSTLMARASADKTPDVVRMDYAWIPRFARSRLLLPLDDYPDIDEVTAPLHKRTLEANRYESKLYGLPLNINTKAAIYNRMLMDKFGLLAPPDSMQEVVRLAREHQVVLGMAGLELWNSLPYFFALGGQLADDAFTEADGYVNSDASVQAVETMLALYREDLLNPWLLEGTGDLWKDVYASWKVFMIDEGPWYYSILMNASDPETDVLKATRPAPFPSNGAYGAIAGGESLVMTKGTKQQKAAWTFIRWMMQEETQALLFQAGLIPSNLETYDQVQIAGTELDYLDAYMKGMEDAFYRPALPQWIEIEELYQDAMEAIFIEGREVREVLDALAVQMDELL